MSRFIPDPGAPTRRAIDVTDGSIASGLFFARLDLTDPTKPVVTEDWKHIGWAPAVQFSPRKDEDD